MGIADAEITVEDVESLMRWWREAGVDTAIDEEPHDWLGGRVDRAPVADPLPAVEALPSTLAEFVEWLMHADLPEAGRRRLKPSGDHDSDLMILTDCPELADLDAGHTMAGPLSEMFEQMLRAIGRTRETVYVASLNPGRPPSGRIADADLDRLAAIARHHVRLVAPKSLWLMGSAASRALLGIDDRAAAGRLHQINLEGVTMKAVATAHPRRLEKKEDKRRAWDEMQRLTAGTDE